MTKPPRIDTEKVAKALGTGIPQEMLRRLLRVAVLSPSTFRRLLL